MSLEKGKGLVIQTDGTAASSLTHDTPARPTAAESVKPLTGRVSTMAGIRDVIGLVWTDLGDEHQRLQASLLRQQAIVKARKSVQSLLEELANQRGMSWSNIARMVGVSVGAIRKWRRDASATAENRLALGKLAAFLDLLELLPIEDPATWLEIPLIEGYTVTGTDLYRAQREILLLEYAGRRIDEEALMRGYDPHWRDKYQTQFRVYKASDGDLAIE